MTQLLRSLPHVQVSIVRRFGAEAENDSCVLQWALGLHVLDLGREILVNTAHALQGMKCIVALRVHVPRALFVWEVLAMELGRDMLVADLAWELDRLDRLHWAAL